MLQIHGAGFEAEAPPALSCNSEDLHWRGSGSETMLEVQRSTFCIHYLLKDECALQLISHKAEKVTKVILDRINFSHKKGSSSIFMKRWVCSPLGLSRWKQRWVENKGFPSNLGANGIRPLGAFLVLPIKIYEEPQKSTNNK